jgi:hypothetical protein
MVLWALVASCKLALRWGCRRAAHVIEYLQEEIREQDPRRLGMAKPT